MARSLRIPWLIALNACVAFAAAGQPFAIHLMDGGSQRGIPMVVLETDNHITLVTDSAGWAVFDEPELLEHSLHFNVSSPGYVLPKDGSGQPGMVLVAKSGQSVEVRMERTNIAERLYRLTGQGIYRDTVLLGKEAPLPFPNLNGDILGQGPVQMSPYQGRLLWIWAGARRATPRCDPFVAGAASDLPGAGGLDLTQGIHLRYFTNDQDEPLSVLPLPGSLPNAAGVSMDGLVAVKDRVGAEHLVVHYVLMKDSIHCLEHGIAELNDRHTFDRKVVLGDEYGWQFPHGHAVEVKDEAGRFLYFATPFCHTRVPADYDAVLTPTTYEALSWSEDDGKLVWQQQHEPFTPTRKPKVMLKKKGIETPLEITDAATHATLSLRDGSVQWSELRKCWIMIASSGESGGDVWYMEARQVTGPWSKAVRVATHGPGTFSAVTQHAALAQAQDNGRFLYIEGTYGNAPEHLPRYEGNQLMYRLDLNDERLAPAHLH